MLSFRPVRSSSSFSWLVAALLLASAVSNHRISAGEPSGDARPSWTSAWDAVRQDEIRAWVRFLAAPELRGRKSGDAGYDLAALWVSTQLEAIGIEPATDDGSYLQPFELLSDPHLAWAEAKLSITDGAGSTEAVPLVHECAVAGRRRGSPLASSELLALDWSGSRWVFAGWGEGAERDAPDDFYGLEIDGDTVVLVVPRDGDARSAHRGAVARGARRVVVVSDERTRGYQPSRVVRGLTLPRHQTDAWVSSARQSLGGADVVYISTKIADRILAPYGTSVDAITASSTRPKSFALDGPRLDLSIPNGGRVLGTANVAARIRGSDPRLADEWIVVGAHLDHVGVSDEGTFFGADDNASGSAAVLAVAKALSRMTEPPRRSVLFLWFGAEEIGLIGSQHYVDHPLVPLDRTVLMVNLDMVGRDESHGDERAEDNKNSLHVVASKSLSLELDPWIGRINEHVGFAFEYDEERVRARSDQWRFIRAGVPAVFFFAGFHPDYHRPSDTPEKLNYEKIERVARLVLGLVWEVADRERRLGIHRL